MDILRLGAYQSKTQYLDANVSRKNKRQQCGNAVASLLPLQAAILREQATKQSQVACLLLLPLRLCCRLKILLKSSAVNPATENRIPKIHLH
jgi:hypothetical protein